MNRNEAIEIVKKNWPYNGFTQLRDALETLIPELRVNEDENIRKEIAEFIDKVLKDKNVLLLVADRIGDDIPSMIPAWIAYLESQKPMYNLEIPAGDVAPAEEDGPFDEDEFLENELSAFLQNYDKEYEDDAAVSDVAKHFYEVGKMQKEQKPEIKYVYPIFKIGDTIKPKAYNESHRIDKIKDDNYVLDNGFTFPIVGQDVWEIVQQKPAEWSEEDKSFYNSIMCEVIKEGMHPTPEQTKWLKSFLERFNLQPKKKWSKEDEKYLNLAINIVASDFGEDSPIVSRLKSLRPQPIQDKFDEAMHVADKYEEGYKAGVYDTKAKSWKPSEEQMKALWVVEDRMRANKAFTLSNRLASLYNDLQKLL